MAPNAEDRLTRTLEAQKEPWAITGRKTPWGDANLLARAGSANHTNKSALGQIWLRKRKVGKLAGTLSHQCSCRAVSATLLK
jgi:hypothetical protein